MGIPLVIIQFCSFCIFLPLVFGDIPPLQLPLYMKLNHKEISALISVLEVMEELVGAVMVEH